MEGTPKKRDLSTIEKSKESFGARGRLPLHFENPLGLALHQGNLFICDHGNHRVQLVSPSRSFLLSIGSYGDQEGQLGYPSDLAVDPSNGRLLVADSFNHRIQVFDLEKGEPLFSFGSNNCASSLCGEFSWPNGICVDQEGNILVSDSGNQRIQVFDRSGAFLRQFGGKDPQQGALQRPSAVALLSSGHVAVSDFDTARVAIYDPRGSFERFLGEEGSLQNPQYLCEDGEGHVIVADSGRKNPCLVVFSQQGEVLKRFGEGDFYSVNAVAVDQAGDIIVSGNGSDNQYRISVF